MGWGEVDFYLYILLINHKKSLEKISFTCQSKNTFFMEIIQEKIGVPNKWLYPCKLVTMFYVTMEISQGFQDNNNKK